MRYDDGSHPARAAGVARPADPAVVVVADNLAVWSRPGPYATAGVRERPVDRTSSVGEACLQRPWCRTTGPKHAEAQLRPISAPTLVIWGQRDRYLGPEHAEPDRDDVPNLDRVERLPDASHWVHHDEPERVTQLLTTSSPPPYQPKTAKRRRRSHSTGLPPFDDCPVAG
jgi:pimeloyl-ACP methyl ester carboxylesterase